MFRSPSGAGLPSFSTMLADLPANLHQVARHLDLSTVTLNKYRKNDQAPRAVMLALFWETRWGRSCADTEAANFGAVHYRQAQGLEREVARLVGVVLRLEVELDRGGSGAANSPVWRVG